MIRTWVVLTLSLGIALPALAPAQASERVSRVSVAQLEEILGKAQSSSDADMASQLSALQLTERFTASRIARWRASLPGHVLSALSPVLPIAPPSSRRPHPIRPPRPHPISPNNAASWAW